MDTGADYLGTNSPCSCWYGWAETGRKKHSVTQNVADFKTLDELYLVQDLPADCEVLVRAEFHPIMWWRPWKKGTVMYLALGHSNYSMENEGFKALVRNGIEWLSGK